MSIVIDNIGLPDDIETGAKYGPLWQTSMVALSSGNEQSNQDWTQGRLTGDLAYGVQNQAGYVAVVAFFNARRGRLRAWLFHDWTDDSLVSESQVTTVNPADGTNRTFLLIKTYEAGGPNPYVRRITRPDVASIVVSVNGLVVSAANYDVGSAGGWFRFHIGFTPPAAATVTVSCTFKVPVRFDKDQMDQTVQWVGAGTIDAITFTEVRDAVNAPPTALALTNTVTTMNEAGIQATGLLTSTANLVDTDTVTIGAKVFTIQATLTNVDGHVKLAATQALTMTNLANAINNSGGVSGTDYAAATTQDIDVSALATATTVALTARRGGTWANAIATTETSANASFGAVTLTGGLASAAVHTRVADIAITDDPFGTDQLYLTGTDAVFFEIAGTTRDDQHLYLKAGTVLNFNTKPTYSVTVNVFDATVGNNPAATASLTLTLVAVSGPPTFATPPNGLNPFVLGIANGTSTASAILMAHGQLVDHSLGVGTNTFSLTGANASMFNLVAVDATHKDLYLNAGATISNNTQYFVTVNVANASFDPTPSDSLNFVLNVGVVPSTGIFDATGDYTVVLYNTLVVELWGAGAGAAGYNTVGSNGQDTTVVALSLFAGGGKAAPLLSSTLTNTVGGVGGIATGGDTNTVGLNGGNGASTSQLGTLIINSPNVTFTGTFQAGDGGNNPGSGAAIVVAGTLFVYPTFYKVYVNGGAGTKIADGGGGSANYQLSPSLPPPGIITFPSYGPFIITLRPGGGQGAYCKITYTAGVGAAPAVGTVLHNIVGLGGLGALDFANGGNGFHGRVKYTVS